MAAIPISVSVDQVSEELAILLCRLRQIKEHEKAGDLTKRNDECRKLFNGGRRTVCMFDGSVETWWDRSSSCYVTQRRDSDGNQIEDANYSGNRTDAAVQHFWALCRLANIT